MNASKLRKPRKCKSCERELHVTAKELQEHSGLCKRAKDIELVLPSVVVPKVGDLSA